MEENKTISQEELEQLKRDAEQGDADAQYNLGGYYYIGEGIEQNYEQAVYWWTKAAEQGLEKASAELDNINEQIIHIGELEQLTIPFEEAERIFLDVVDKTVAEKKHKSCKEVTLDYVIAGHAMNLTIYREDYAKGDCFREKALFYFYTGTLKDFNIAEWRIVLYKALQCMRSFPVISPIEYIWYHHAARIAYQANGDDTHAKRHLYCQYLQEAIIADEDYLMRLIEQNRNRPDQHRTLLLAIFYYALLTDEAGSSGDYGWTRERHALIEMALKEATICYAENEEYDPKQRAFIYLCRYIYYKKTLRVKLAEEADRQLGELLETLAPQGVNAQNFGDTAISAIADEIGEILIDPFIIAVENVFVDLIEEEEDSISPEEENKTISQEELKQLMRDAISGNEGAQCKLGFCYQNGKGVEEDLEKAIFWYQKAVEQNDKVAQLALGRIYLLEENDEAWEKGISLITQSAEQGLVLAMSELGFEYYYRGKTEDKYNELAVYWLTKAADLDDASSQRWLGQCYLNGCGVEKDEKQAVYWYTKAAEQGYAQAQFLLSLCYSRGLGVEKDMEKAVDWSKKAAEQGLPEAQFALGVYYEDGTGVACDMEQTIYWYTQAAEQGYAQAQFQLGMCYDYGHAIEKDSHQAVHWYTLAAEQGFAEAQYLLGLCYSEGDGVEQDCTQAVYWWGKAAEQGNAEAQHNLGYCYLEGEGVEKDEKAAIYWLTKAAEQGDEEAQYGLGMYYSDVEDYEQAIYWYRKAVEQGNAGALNDLGYCYENGLGVEVDREEALRLCRLSAEQGCDYAQFNLAECYAQGRGVEQDLEQAIHWYTLAAEQGDEDAIEALERLASND